MVTLQEDGAGAWRLLRDGLMIGVVFDEADAKTIAAALNAPVGAEEAPVGVIQRIHGEAPEQEPSTIRWLPRT